MARRLDLWLPSWVLGAPARARARRARRGRTTHVFFLVCDHYEPRHKTTRPERAAERVETWRREYPAFQELCRARFGHAPLHSWFYPPHHGAEHLSALAQMAHAGGGEVELHYHHDGDTAETLTRDLRATLALYHRHGLLLESGAPPRTAFGFVHGDWTLDNACNGVHCGVNGELSLLAGLGCWGDFTMPSANEAQTRKINSIYYATDDPRRHKSHDRGVDLEAGSVPPPGFFLMQGPLGLNWRAPGYPRVENASLTSANWGRPDRVRAWLDCGVHVKGRPEWLFVKLHTHGAMERDFDALFGQKALDMHQTLNELCHDGRHALHYVTARQAYNLAKAAEAGAAGDPRPWLDHVVAPPVTAWYALAAPHRVEIATAQRLRIADVEPGASGAPALLRTRLGKLRELRGPWRSVDLGLEPGTPGGGGAIEIAIPRAGALQLEFEEAVDLDNATTVGMLNRAGEDGRRWRLEVGAPGVVRLRYRGRAVVSA